MMSCSCVHALAFIGAMLGVVCVVGVIVGLLVFFSLRIFRGLVCMY